ncbi:hypothetical protein [Haloplanus halobius]|uniref:hypothetical protein n=1 Tax=Haloplanus halobius TaxID=2934938 RepID=UPI00200E42CC|nr:hypothetical protein [Haloplanus sp. XH21]
MADPRIVAAAVLGVLIGALCILAPEAVARTQTIGRGPPGRGGDYGADRDLPARWRRVIQALGVGCLLAGLYFATVALG